MPRLLRGDEMQGYLFRNPYRSTRWSSLPRGTSRS